VLGYSRIAAEKTVLAEEIQVARLRDRARRLRRNILVEARQARLPLDELPKLRIGEAGELEVERVRIEPGQERAQLLLVPLAAYAVQGEVERLLALLVSDRHEHRWRRRRAQVLEDLQALMPADEDAVHAVDHERLHHPELRDAALQRLVVVVAGLQ